MAQEERKETISDYYEKEKWENGKYSGPVIGTFKYIVKSITNFIVDTVGQFVESVFGVSRTKERNMKFYEQGLKDAERKERENTKKEKELSEDMEEEVLDEESRDYETNIILANKDIQEYMKSVGITAFPGDGDVILLAFENKDQNDQIFGKITKESLIKGKANLLGEAILQARLKTASVKADIVKLKDEAMLDGFLTSAKIKSKAYEMDYEEHKGRLESDVVADMQYTGRNGVVELKAVTDPTTITNDGQQSVVFQLNGKDIVKCGFDSLKNNDPDVLSEVKRQIIKEESKSRNQIHYIGKDKEHSLSFKTLKNGNISVKYQKNDVGIYRMEKMSDIQKLAKDIESTVKKEELAFQNGEETQQMSPEAVAFTIAIVSNPDIEQVTNNDGRYLDPITQNFEEAGKGHFQITHDLHGVKIESCYSDDKTEMKRLEMYQYRNSNELSRSKLNQIAVSIDEQNQKHIDSQVMDDYVRIQFTDAPSCMISENEARMILEQNRLDERAVDFIKEPKQEIGDYEMDHAKEGDSLNFYDFATPVELPQGFNDAMVDFKDEENIDLS